MARLFFSLWPDETVRGRISLATDNLQLCEGRRLAKSNYHMTLAFLGNVSEETEERLSHFAANLRYPACGFRLERSGWWPKPKIAWLAPTLWPEELGDLARDLNDAARDMGISMPERPWRPHVTVARKIKTAFPEREIEPIDWQIADFCLVESITGDVAPEYRVKASWPLEIM